jgi:serine/threonine protein kinase
MDETEYFNRRLGQTLQGKWTLERLLGAGGMAAVYVGRHRIGRRDAIKILHPEVAANPEVRGRFEQEAHAVNRLRHPGAVEVRDFDVTEDGCPFLVMELLEGESLSSKLDRGPVQLADLLRWTDELLEVLAAAHDLGIIHRDIKPDNLFIQTDGRLKVLDFGIARMREGAPRAMITRTGTALGTLSYMPPEQARGIHIDGRADLYSVGATLFRALARKRLHEGETDADVLIKVATTPVPMLRSVAPDVPGPVAEVVDCALSFEREYRYPDARTMQADVRAVLAGQHPPYAAAHPPPPRFQTSPPPSAAPPSSGSHADDRTRAEGAGARSSQPIATAATDPAPTRVDMRASGPVSATAMDRTVPQNVPAPVAAAAPATRGLPPAAFPPAAAARPSRGLLWLALGGGALLLLMLAAIAIAGAIWTRQSSDDDTPAASNPGVIAPTQTSGVSATGGAVGTPPITTTTSPDVPPLGLPPAKTPPNNTSPPPGITVPPPGKTAAPPTATTPPAASTPPSTTSTTRPPPSPPPKKDKGGDKQDKHGKR